MELVIVIGFIGIATLMVAEIFGFFYGARRASTATSGRVAGVRTATTQTRRRVEIADDCYDAAA